MEESNNHNEQLPVYNIKAVSRLVGLLPVTLRAWERRYGLPNPMRGDQGYRLYSEHDLRTLRWLKNQIESGFSIGRAALYLQELRQAGQDPAEKMTPRPQTEGVSPVASPSLIAMSGDLLDRLLHFDAGTATLRALPGRPGRTPIGSTPEARCDSSGRSRTSLRSIRARPCVRPPA